jgi:hypothetical protein
MMAALFGIYLLVFFLFRYEQKNLAFVLIFLNVILSFLMFLHHATDIVNIRL